LGDRKGIKPVKNPAPAIHKGSSVENPRGPGLTWSNLWKNTRVKQKPEVVDMIRIDSTNESNGVE